MKYEARNTKYLWSESKQFSRDGNSRAMIAGHSTLSSGKESSQITGYIFKKIIINKNPLRAAFPEFKIIKATLCFLLNFSPNINFGHNFCCLAGRAGNKKQTGIRKDTLINNSCGRRGHDSLSSHPLGQLLCSSLSFDFSFYYFPRALLGQPPKIRES